MAKNDGILGIDVRHGKLSLSVMKGGKIQKTLWTDVPGNIVDDYKILSDNLFAEFLKDKLKENRISAKKADFVIADTDLLIRSFDMPVMSDEQLKLNIPFEFKDYILGDMKEFIFDFVKRDPEEDKDSANVSIFAYAVSVEYIRRIGNILRLAGLKLEKAIPETLVYEALLANVKDQEEAKKDMCFLEIGSNRITMHMFRDVTYRLSHVIDIGENKIIQSIADELNVDVNTAETYLRNNFQNCQDSRGAVDSYKDISLEIIKCLNYYDMSDMTAKLKDIVICGPGALTEPLVALLKDRIDKSVYTMQEMFQDEPDRPELSVSFASATVISSDLTDVGIIESEAYADVKKTDWKLVALGIVALIALLVLAVKVGIVDKYAALNKARAYEAELQTRVDADTEFIKKSEELSVEYYHYTWDDMTEEEKGRVSRMEVAKLADFIASQGVSVNSMNLTGTTLVVGVTGDSLNTMSKLTAALTDQEIVESCSLSMAQKETTEGSTATALEAPEFDENGELIEDSIETTNTGNIVNAEINIYLTTLKTDVQGGE